MKKKWRNSYNVHELCDHAFLRLKEAGFERVAVSMKSATVYFSYPGRHGNLRVSTHSTRHSPIGQRNVVAKLTFRGNSFDQPDTMRCSWEKIETMIAIAIGQYMLHSAEPLASNYKGKRGTWEHALVAQGIERPAPDREVAGSIPAERATPQPPSPVG